MVNTHECINKNKPPICITECTLLVHYMHYTILTPFQVIAFLFTMSDSGACRNVSAVRHCSYTQLVNLTDDSTDAPNMSHDNSAVIM